MFEGVWDHGGLQGRLPQRVIRILFCFEGKVRRRNPFSSLQMLGKVHGKIICRQSDQKKGCGTL